MKHVAAAVLLMFAQSAAAQSELPTMHLLVENVKEMCGVTQSSIEAAAKSAARYNRITIQEKSLYTLYVNVALNDNGTVCGASLDVQIYSLGFSDFNGTQMLAPTVFCTSGSTGVLRKSGGTGLTVVTDSLKHAVDRCLALLDENPTL